MFQGNKNKTPVQKKFNTLVVFNLISQKKKNCIQKKEAFFVGIHNIVIKAALKKSL